MYKNYYIKNRTLHIRSKFILDKKEEYESMISQLPHQSSIEIQHMKERIIHDIVMYHHHPNCFIEILDFLLQNVLDECNILLNLPKEWVQDYIPALVYRL
jgi:3-polyprenyl-4-hydroxybenzoate decarboxylase